MGLISVAKKSVKSVIGDQWLDVIRCNEMNEDTLIAKGVSRNGTKWSTADIISKNSLIVVSPGEAIIILDNGVIADYCDVPGEYRYDKSTVPSIFSGKLGESIKESIKLIGTRFIHAGDVARKQVVYYVNTKVILGLKYGTPTPVVFNDKIYRTIEIRFAGSTNIKVTDPIQLFTNVVGANVDVYKTSNIWEKYLRQEFVMYMSDAVATLGQEEVSFNELPVQQVELAHKLNQEMGQKWAVEKGLEIVDVAILTVSIPPKYQSKIDEIDKVMLMKGSEYSVARTKEAQAKALELAAANEGGSLLAFAGLNMTQQYMNNQGNVNEKMGLNWTCSCGQTNDSNFCTKCGNPRVQSEWKCECGKTNSGRFCTSCGNEKQASWKCSCGTTNSGQFCSECGTKNSGDITNDTWKCECGETNKDKFCTKCGKRVDA